MPCSSIFTAKKNSWRCTWKGTPIFHLWKGTSSQAAFRCTKFQEKDSPERDVKKSHPPSLHDAAWFPWLYEFLNILGVWVFVYLWLVKVREIWAGEFTAEWLLPSKKHGCFPAFWWYIGGKRLEETLVFNQAHTRSSHKHYGHYGSKWVTPKIHLVATLNITRNLTLFLVTPNFEFPNFANIIEWTPSTQHRSRLKHCTRPWRWSDKKVSWEKWGTQVKGWRLQHKNYGKTWLVSFGDSRWKKAVPQKYVRTVMFLGIAQIYLFIFLLFFFIRN